MKKTILSLLAMLLGISAFAAERAVTVWEGEFNTDKQKNSGKWTTWANILELGPELWPQITAGDRIVFNGHKRQDAEGNPQIQLAYVDAANDFSWETLVEYADLNGSYTLNVDNNNLDIVRSGLKLKGQNAVITSVVWYTSSESGSTNVTEGNFKVSGTKIYDAKNNEFIMRGVNYSWCWQRGNEASVIPAAKRIGCNTIRIQLGDGKKYYKPSAQELEYLISLCEQNKLVVMFNTHDETGSNSVDDLRRAVDFWIEMKDVLNRHTSTTIVNISNEWFGQWNNAEGWANGYKEAIPKLRQAGLKNLLVVDAAGYGQWPQSIFSKGAEVAATDPDKNTVFSIHFYQDAGGTDQKVKSNIDNALKTGFPLIIGEFAYRHQGHDIAYQTIMDYCQEKNVGWLVWSWTGNGGGTEECDMFGSYDDSQYRPNGEYTVKGKNGIKETSVECSVFNESGKGEEPVDPIVPDPEDPDKGKFTEIASYTPAEPYVVKSWNTDATEIPASFFADAKTGDIIRLSVKDYAGGQIQYAAKDLEWNWTTIVAYDNLVADNYDINIANTVTEDEDPLPADTFLAWLKHGGLHIKGQKYTFTGAKLLRSGSSSVIDNVENNQQFDFNAPYEIYTVTGQRTAEMIPGNLYILRQGTIVIKQIAR